MDDNKHYDIDDENEEEVEIEISKFQKVINFLDAKKWIFFIIILLILFIAFAIDAFLKRDQNDVHILYTGYQFIDDENITELKEACGYISNDYNGDDILMVDFLSMIVDKKMDFEGNYTYDPTMITRFNTELNTSSSIIFIVENSYYDVLRSSGLLLPISNIINDVPEGAIDETGILFGTLDISIQEGFNNLSPDSIICIRRPAAENEIKYISEKQYEHNLDFFKKLIEYKIDK